MILNVLFIIKIKIKIFAFNNKDEYTGKPIQSLTGGTRHAVESKKIGPGMKKGEFYGNKYENTLLGNASRRLGQVCDIRSETSNGTQRLFQYMKK